MHIIIFRWIVVVLSSLMVVHLSPIYSELQRLKIHEFQGDLKKLIQTMRIREFVTAVTRSISDLKGRPWKSKTLRMPYLVRLRSLTILRSIWWNFFFALILNNGILK